MCADLPNSQPAPLPDVELGPLIAAFLDSNGESGEQLFGVLSHHAAITARHFLQHSGPEIDDIVQDTVVAVLEWLRRQDEFTGDLVSFTITVARNRCRNYVVWRRRHQGEDTEDLAEYLADPARGPLDTLLEEEKNSLLQEAFDSLDRGCRTLLHAIYFNDDDIEALRRREGLKTLQSVYHRRSVCLKKFELYLKNRLFGCSSDGGTNETPSRKNRFGRNHD